MLKCAVYDLRKAKAARNLSLTSPRQERANFCGYFEPSPGRFRPGTSATSRDERPGVAVGTEKEVMTHVPLQGPVNGRQ